MKQENSLFAKNLTTFMDYYGYNQTTLGKAIGKAPSTVATWVHGEKFPRLGVIDDLAKLFHCKRSDLLENDISASSIENTARYYRLTKYMEALTDAGITKAVEYFEDLNPKFYKGEE